MAFSKGLCAILSIGGLLVAGAAHAAQPHCFGMVCCPPGQALHGVQLSHTSLLCLPVPVGAEDCFVDYSTQRNNMHACPRGTYMRGLHAENNLLTCCFDRERGYSELGSEFVDGAHQEGGMHACPNGAMLTGIRTDQNLFSCAVVKQSPPVPDPVRIAQDPELPRINREAKPTEAWKRATRNWLHRILDLPLAGPPAAPPVTVVREEIVDNGFVKVTRRLIRYQSAYDKATVSAYLLLPEGYPNQRSYDAVFVTHGHYDSKDATAIDWGNKHHAAALYLAQNGFVVLAPDTRSFGDFKPVSLPLASVIGSVVEGAYHKIYMDYIRPTAKLTDLPWGLGGMPRQFVLDGMTGVSVLAAQRAVSRGRLFSYGLSLGGWQALWIGANDERIQGSVVAGIFLANNCLNEPEKHERCQSVPSLWSRAQAHLPLLDTPDLARLVRGPVFTTFGTADPYYDQQGTDLKICRETARAAMAGVDGFSSVEIADMGHAIDNLTSLDHFLGRKTTAQRSKGAPVLFPITNRCNGMHCCHAGRAMLGAKLDADDFLCQPAGAATDPCHVETATQRQGMLACPVGEYVRGLDAKQKKLTCCSNASLTLRREAVDRSTVLQVMHACPSAKRQQSVMTGIDFASNKLLCAMP